MLTNEERVDEVNKVILELEGHIKEAKASGANLAKAQTYLDGVEKEFPPTSAATPRNLLATMYELQALIDYAKGGLPRTKAFIAEAKKVNPGHQFVSETIRELAQMSGHVGDAQVPFFVTSARRYILMSIVTLGLYSTYWFYKNWKVLEVTTGKKQWPILSAIFSGFLSYRLFRDINETAEANGHSNNFSAGWRAVLFFLFGALALININTPMERAGGVRANKFAPGEIVLLVLGVAYWALLFVAPLITDTTYETSGTTGLVVSRTNFMNSCVDEAMAGANGFNAADADSYCGCVYDTGTDRFGGEGFTDRVEELADTNHLTPAMNDLVNECVAQL